MKPVARPKATCEAMNQGQLTRALSAGLIDAEHGPEECPSRTSGADQAAPEHVPARQHRQDHRVEEPGSIEMSVWATTPMISAVAAEGAQLGEVGARHRRHGRRRTSRLTGYQRLRWKTRP